MSEDPSFTILILDAKYLRSYHAMEHLGNKLNKLYITEYDAETFDLMYKKLSGNQKIKLYNIHVEDYIKGENFDPNINVIYLDAMLSFFSSDRTDGADKIIESFLKRSQVNEMIFAATFCLRCGLRLEFKQMKKKILTRMKILFLINGFKPKFLLREDEIIYRGQTQFNNGMMFVLFYLSK